MSTREYESTLNVWLAEGLRHLGLDATAERGRGGGRRIDVEVRLDQIRIAIEAEQGQTSNQKASAIMDADQRLEQRLADCALALCYPEGITQADFSHCEFIYTLRSFEERPAASESVWSNANLTQLVRVIQQIPAQLGDPDRIAKALSVSLDLAVGRLSESQKRDLAEALDLPAGNPTRMGQPISSRYNQAAKRAMLVIATAVMFHTQLDQHRRELKPELDNRLTPPEPFNGDWPPPNTSDCVHNEDPIGAFYDAWDLWLAVDYKPIFATACSALRGCAQDSAFTAAVKETTRAAATITRNIVGLRHDMLGRIFHTVLDTARYDGSFYTTTAAATLLATLAISEDLCDWSDPEAITRLRITDPACGTGTLLMAAAERIRDLSGGARENEAISRALIESVLTGYDVNLTATHMAATTLGLLSPTTSFREMKIGRALLGVEGGKAYLGSLEFLGRESFPQMMPWPTGVEQIETEQEIVKAEPADLIIMNPPFTRDSLRHDQFTREEENLLKARERELFDSVEDAVIHRSHNGGGFLALAEQITKTCRASIAAVLPTVGATNYSTLSLRKFLAMKFHIETIVSSHDPQRIYFSENTNIGEMLLICRRCPNSEDKPPTNVINLYENPATPAAALSVAQSIIEGKTDGIKGTMQQWPAKRIAAGNWGAVQFLSPYLCERFIDLRAGKYFPIRQLGLLAEIGPAGQGVRGIFDRSELPDDKAMVALWYHKTDVTQEMAARTDTYIIPKPGKEKQAADLWAKRGLLFLPFRVFLPTIRCMSVRLNEKALGSLWIPCKPYPRLHNKHLLEKAFCVFLNSSIGVLAMLGDRTNKKPTYPQFSMDDLRRIPVPDFVAMDATPRHATPRHATPRHAT
ncbi:MAG: hypothetical protein OXG02_00660, partial [Chloroflexi bacterium]|nr:hypothetical protein [Chloroflexota bacterium]